MDKIWEGMDVTVDSSLEQLVLDTRINLQHLRVVFQHLVKIILGIEFAHSRNAQSSADHQLFRGRSICSKITHGKSPFARFSVQKFKVQSLGLGSANRISVYVEPQTLNLEPRV